MPWPSASATSKVYNRGLTAELVHDYDGLNLERLLETATQDIPVINRVVENHLRAHTDRN